MSTNQTSHTNKEYSDVFDQFIEFFKSGSVLLMFATLVAVIWANVSHETYHHFWHSPISIATELFDLKLGLTHWVNDGLMAIFFFVVGLEIKREFLAGELSSFKQASLPIFAAIGGMVVPIILYLSFGFKGSEADGWGIPMATDIAFSLGILAMLGKRVPLSLKVFLTALAIVDDLGAVLVIALFYGGDLNWMNLLIAGGLLLVLVIANLKNYQGLRLYTFLGFVIWYFFLMSGVDGPGTGIHCTIAGVLIAFTIPARPKVKVNEFIDSVRDNIQRFDKSERSDNPRVLTDEQLHAIHKMEVSADKVQSPLQKLEHDFHGFIGMFVLPVFALANAGVSLFSHGGQGESNEVFTTLSFAIAFSLVFGKAIGISLFSWIAVKLKIANKPKYSSWLSFVGLGLLGGIGFTMSIFIASLGFTEESTLLNQAKIGIFIGSIVAAVCGLLVLKYSLKKDEKSIPPSQR